MLGPLAGGRPMIEDEENGEESRRSRAVGLRKRSINQGEALVAEKKKAKRKAKTKHRRPANRNPPGFLSAALM